MYGTFQSNRLLRISKNKNPTTKKVFHKKVWFTGVVQIHMETLLDQLIKSKNDTKLERYAIKIKLRRDPTSEKSDLYKFKIALFDKRRTRGVLGVCSKTSK